VTLGKLLDRLARFMVLRHAGKSQPNSHSRITGALSVNDLRAARQALLDVLEITREAILDGLMQDETAFWHLDEKEPRTNSRKRLRRAL
jgi:DNA-binding FadR family transcriptional regulator